MSDKSGNIFVSFYDGIIELDSGRAEPIEFTSDRFGPRSYLWKTGNVVIISFIHSLRKGNFRQLVERIRGMGLDVHIPTPIGRMEHIVRNAGYRMEFRDFVGSPIEVWILDDRCQKVQEDKVRGETNEL